MIKNYIIKRAVKNKMKWLAKTEAKIALTAVATVLTQNLIRKAMKKSGT